MADEKKKLVYRPKPGEYLPHKPGEAPKRAQPPQMTPPVFRPKPGEYLPHKPGEMPERAEPPRMLSREELAEPMKYFDLAGKEVSKEQFDADMAAANTAAHQRIAAETAARNQIAKQGGPMPKDLSQHPAYQELIAKLKRGAGEKSLTPEMINKANSGDK